MRIFHRLFSWQRFFTPARRRYPWLIGGALWLGWILSLVLGLLGGPATGPVDRFGQLVGADFAAFYTAGRILDSGQAARLYDFGLARQIQVEIYGGAEAARFYPYLNPPHYAALVAPLSRIPYLPAVVLWMALNLALGYFGLRLLGSRQPGRDFLLALTWLPAWAAITFGQNSFLSLSLFALVCRFWQDERPFAAGAAAALLLYKPQLLIGLGLLWILERPKGWKSLGGLAIGGLLIVGGNFLLLPEASLVYVRYLGQVGANLMTLEGFPIWNAHGLQTFFFGILPGMKSLAQVLYLGFAVAGVWFFMRFRRAQPAPALRFAAALCLTAWVTPYLMVYDWTLLLLPALLFWQNCPARRGELRVLYALLWTVMLFSGAATVLQWNALGWAVQISVPALGFVLIGTAESVAESKITP